jgi:hypothetical protein
VRIDRFGDQYASAYPFPQNMMEDNWSFSRPAVYARVGGLPGAFDFYGDSNFPFDPFVVTKKFTLHANGDHAAVETLIDQLRAATIGLAAESKLWFLLRSGGTTWMWAKCTRLDVAENWQSYFALTATVEFFCRQGVWSPL